jgi:hypothetical protein
MSQAFTNDDDYVIPMGADPELVPELDPELVPELDPELDPELVPELDSDNVFSQAARAARGDEPE